MRWFAALGWFFLLAPGLLGQQQVINTAAGGGRCCLISNVALDGSLGEITSVLVDPQGKVYAADVSNQLLISITPAVPNFAASYTGPVFVRGLRLDYDPGFPRLRLALDAAGNIYALEPASASGDKPPRVLRWSASESFPTATVIVEGGFSRPNGIAVDSQGNIFVADTGNARIQRIGTNGSVTTVAGTGACGFSGDGGPATSAQICEPYTVAPDNAGNLLIADYGNSRIRRVDAAGRISTIAGKGERGEDGDNGPALAARIAPSSGLVVDAAGFVYFTNNNRIRRISPDGIITTIAGTSSPNFLGDGGPAVSASLRQPEGIFVAQNGDIYIADTGNWRIRRITNGIINTMAGNGAFGLSGDGGAAIFASLNVPYGVAVDRDNNSYYSDIGSHRVRKTAGGVITTFAGRGRGFAGDGGPATEALLSMPADIAFDGAGNLYIADSDNGRIRRVTTDGIIRTVAGGGPPTATGDGIPATSAYLASPTGVTVDAAGNIYIAEALGGRVRKVTPDGIISTVGSFFFPAHVTASRGNLYVSIPALGRARRDGGVVRVAPDGTRTVVVGSMVQPGAVALDASGNILVTETSEHRILLADSAGNVTTFSGTGVAGFSGDLGPPAAAALNTPIGLSFDPTARFLYIADSGNKRIRRVTNCIYLPPPANYRVGSSAGTGGFNVLTDSDCPWTARSNADWIILTRASGLGLSPVFFSFTDNTQPSDRTGTISFGSQTFTLTQQGSAAFTSTFEPLSTVHLKPGWYKAEVTPSQDAPGGYWGLEVAPLRGLPQSKFFFGGGLPANAVNPGYGAFLAAEAAGISVAIPVSPLAPDVHLNVRVLDANRRVVADSAFFVAGYGTFLSAALNPGFYIIEVTSDATAPINYMCFVDARSLRGLPFAGGLDAGGYVGPGMVGFAEFFLPEEQDVRLRVFGKNTLGSFGAPSLQLTIRDDFGNVIAVTTPP